MNTKEANFAGQADRTAESDRAIHQRVDRADVESKIDDKPPPQTGQREYPVPPLPKQHQLKPGSEADLDPRPMFEAPHYRGSEKLRGMVAINTGGDSGIGRSVAVLFAREGADVAIVYLDEHQDAEETKHAVEREGRRCLILAGDVSDPAFCRSAVAKPVYEFGRLNILVNNAAFQERVPRLEGPHGGTIRPDAEDQPLRLLSYGEGPR